MHILVTNDDGPPSPHSSPYVHSLVRELQAAGHVVSVCLPHTQRSWIGKAHMIGQTVKPTYYRPPPPSEPAAGLLHPDGAADRPDRHGTTHPRPSRIPGTEEWVLVDGTPASCVQIGLHHFFRERGPIDLVVSGPNYGRNTTAVFALSSGTLGGALEAAVCCRRAIALSYAFFTRNHDPDIIAAASRRSVRVIEALARQWPVDGSVDLYSVNVPLVEGLEKGKVLYTEMLRNYWGRDSCFTEAEDSVDGEDEEEERIREGESEGTTTATATGASGYVHKHRQFKWSPKFSDVYKSVEEAPPGNDGWTVKEGHTSVNPLRACFFQAATHLHGTELQLEAEGPSIDAPAKPNGGEVSSQQMAHGSKPESGPRSHLWALVAYEDDYVQPLILSAMRSLFPPESFTLLEPPALGGDEVVSLASMVPGSGSKILQITPYERIDWDYALGHPESSLVNSYMIRKALIRKHFLSATVDSWVAKHPGSILKTNVKRSEAFEVDYAEFLDDALIEAFDLRASLDRNATLPAAGREWWILKPGMSDRGQGIRLFSTMAELQGIFDAWEEGQPDSDDDEEGEEDDDDGGVRDLITASHLRHFVAQPYIDPPLLLQPGGRKFHVRAYVLAVGCLRVYVYRPMLALFAARAYRAPWADGGEAADLDAHLTNTCRQAGGGDSAAVARLADLNLAEDVRRGIEEQVCAATGEAFEAAARGMAAHFRPTANAFEVFGVDFLVDADGRAWLLEMNAFPDFRQTGEDPRLREVVAGFWEGVLRLAVGPFAGGGAGSGAGGGDGEREDDMALVREVELGRR